MAEASGLTKGVADKHVHRFLARLFRCCALQTKAEVAAASKLVSAMGLPWHHDPQKNWDTLKCLMHILAAGRLKVPVLDAGSSKSVIGSWLSTLGYREIYACDLLEKNGGFFEKYKINFSIQDLTRTNYPIDFFQAVTCVSVIEHNVDLESFCAEMRRVLRPGGLLLVSTDYWDEPIDCTGIYPYGPEGGEMHIFSAREVQDFIALAAKHDLRICTPFDATTRDKAIRWERVDRDYTFAFLAFRRTR